jgi:dTDP-4-amino-4,6-dideoxygalactose transaminase
MNTLKKIACLDLKSQHSQIKKEIFSAFEDVYENTAFSGGTFVEKFEKTFATYIGTKHAIAVNNGTSALHLALIALGIGEGDEVILPANTFIATAWAISYVRATPVFVDCDSEHWEIDPVCIENAITQKTKAIIGVHLYGMPFDIDVVHGIAKKHGLYLIEDAAQAQGAKYKGNNVGTFGEMACFSFYPGKNLGACGEAGGITTNHDKYKDQLHSLRNHGSKIRYYHDEIGFNMRMGGLEAASLSVKINHLENWNQRRKEIARMYHEGIHHPLIKMQKQTEWADSIYHLFVITCEKKQELVDHLKSQGIEPGFHYPVPCHLQKAYHHLAYQKGDMPNAEYLSKHCLSLPMYPELNNNEVNRVIESISVFTC